MIVTGSGLKTLEAVLVDRFISSHTRQADETQLAKLGLVREDDCGVPRATVAGVLLCTERPDEYISGAAIEAIRSPCQCAVAVSQSMGSPRDSFWMTMMSGDDVS